MKRLYLIYPLIFGFAAAYLISGFAAYKIRPVMHQPIVRTEFEKKINNDKAKFETVIKKNVFSVEIGTPEKEKKYITEIGTAKSENLNGYNLIGFAQGKNPMALFKKNGKPLVIIDRKDPFNKKWYLMDISGSIVYLKDKENGKIKKFFIKLSKTESGIMNNSIEHYNQHVNYNGITHITLQRRLIKEKMTDFNRFLKNVQINPYFKGAKTIGYRLSYISKASILNKIGLKRGDIIVSVNGKPTSNPLKMMNLYSQLSNMTSVNLNILRNGIKKTIFVEVE